MKPNHFTFVLHRHVSTCCALVIGLLAATGCHEPSRRYVEQYEEGQSLPILRQFTGRHCSEYAPLRIVVRNTATFAKIPIVDTRVNFENEMMLIVTLGEVASDLYQVEIDHVWREGNRIRVTVATTPPPSNAPLIHASPFCVAIVPRSDLNVEGFLTEPPPRRRTR